MDLLPTLERLGFNASEAAARRLLTTLTVDPWVLRGMRAAAQRGGAAAQAAYGWALGVVDQTDPIAAADAYAQAAVGAPDDPAVQFGCALANAGSFAGRRGLSVASRRTFATAAELDGANLLTHLGVAAARLGSGDRAGLEEALDRAIAAPEWRLYDSPLGPRLRAESPWLAQNLALLWPERGLDLLRYVADGTAYLARRAGERGRDAAPYLTRLESLARRLAEAPLQHSVEVLAAIGLVVRALAARAELRGDAPAAEARLAALAVGDALQQERRAVAARFEPLVRSELAVAGVGVGLGLTTAAVGLVRSRRRWPPPFPVALPGRQIAWLGAGLAAGSLAAVTVPNPLTATLRRRVERRLLGEERLRAEAALSALRGLLADLPAGS